MGETAKTLVPRLIVPTEPASGISLCLHDLLMQTRTVDLKEIPRLSRFVPVIVLIPESSAHRQKPCDRSASEAELTRVLRIFPKPSERWKMPHLEGEFLFGRVTVNFMEMSAQRDGEPVVLTTMEFKTLQYLIQNPRRVISRAELLNQVWGYENYPRTRTVDNHILRLRQKLEQNPSRPVHIRTIHGAGYKFLP